MVFALLLCAAGTVALVVAAVGPAVAPPEPIPQMHTIHGTCRLSTSQLQVLAVLLLVVVQHRAVLLHRVKRYARWG